MSKKTSLVALLTADWHLTHNNWKHRPEINGDALYSLKQVVKYAQDLHLPILAAGDIFDIPRTSTELLRDIRDIMFQQCAVAYVNGNHDKVTPSWFEVVLGQRPIDNGNRLGVLSHWTLSTGIPVDPDQYGLKQELPGGKKKHAWFVYGIEYMETAEKLQERLDALIEQTAPNPMKHILVLHQGLEGLIPNMTAELMDGMIPDWVDMVLCGHIHMSTVTSIKTKGGKEIPLISPGSLHLCAINEEPVKKLYFLGADGSVWSTPLVTRRVINANFCGSPESDVRTEAVKIAKAINRPKKERPEEIRTPIVRIAYDGTTAPKIRTIFGTALQAAEATAHVFYTNKEEKVSEDLQTVVDDGIDSSFTSSSFDHAKAAFLKMEKDAHVRRIVEEWLAQEPSQENYDKVKEEILTKKGKRK